MRAPPIGWFLLFRILVVAPEDYFAVYRQEDLTLHRLAAGDGSGSPNTLSSSLSSAAIDQLLSIITAVA
jgi:hypothetical protein